MPFAGSAMSAWLGAGLFIFLGVATANPRWLATGLNWLEKAQRGTAAPTEDPPPRDLKTAPIWEADELYIHASGLPDTGFEVNGRFSPAHGLDLLLYGRVEVRGLTPAEAETRVANHLRRRVRALFGHEVEVKVRISNAGMGGTGR